jgi:HEAT repeat protein
LSQIGKPAVEAVSVLLAMLADPEPETRVAAAETLWDIDSRLDGVSVLADVLRCPIADARISAALAFWRIAGRLDGIPALIDCLGSPDADTRDSAAFTLSRIGPAARDAIPALRALLGDKELMKTAQCAITAIETRQADGGAS